MKPVRIDSDPSSITAGRALRESSNDGELTEEDLEAIDTAMHADKLANGYDCRREEAATKLERDSALFRGGR